ncbi:MAG: LysM peptidoglycan-binding domain-containing protein [Polyangia bacterium]
MELSAALASFAFLAVGAAAAQDDVQYERDLEPGLSIHYDGGDSALARAAREGTSVVIAGRGPVRRETQKDRYTVREGDTLWDICIEFFGDPYVWPRVWSYNPRITNPHWIYPGEVVRLRPGQDQSVAADEVATPAPAVQRRSSELLVRNRGFVDSEGLEQAGEVVGAHKQVSMLAQHDEAYAEFPEDVEIRPGDEFSAYEILGPVDGIEDPDTAIGKLVEILGVVRVTSFDREDRIARVVIDESMRPITRGTKLGEVHRRFDLVPPVVNGRDLDGHIIAFLDPVQMAAEHQIVFVDRGREDGVREGNRFFAVEQRDRYRRSQDRQDDREGFPTEVLAEMRVIEARPHTATCLVTASVLELRVGEKVEMVEGY